MTGDFDPDAELDAELSFEPTVSATGADPAGRPTAPIADDTADDTTIAQRDVTDRSARRSRRGLGRKVGALALMVGALGAMGGGYAVFASSSGAAQSAETQSAIDRGRQLYEVSCITCHGANLQGVKDQGPSLINVGEAAAYFQVATGRMPVTAQGAYIPRKSPRYDEADTEAIAKYIQSIGGGPTLPTGDLRAPDSDIAAGGILFRLNCASCHGTTFAGAPLSAGAVAPGLKDATDKEIIAAMISGPENMPVFSNNQITVEQKKEIVSYIQTLKASDDPGGNGIDRIGPVSEAIVIWVGGVGFVIIAILWIGAKAS